MTKDTPAIPIDPTSKGKRPYFFEDPAMDQMMTFLMELSTEVSVLYDRLDVVERLLDEKGTISRDDIEAYRPSPEAENERIARREAYVKRVFRMHKDGTVEGR